MRVASGGGAFEKAGDFPAPSLVLAGNGQMPGLQERQSVQKPARN